MREMLHPYLNKFLTLTCRIEKFGNYIFDPNTRTIEVNPVTLLKKPLRECSDMEPLPHDPITTLIVDITCNGNVLMDHSWIPNDATKYGCFLGDYAIITGFIKMYQYNKCNPLIKQTTPFNYKVIPYSIVKLIL